MGTYDGDCNLIDDNSTPIRFLYNGQAGVETDANGLYYMRARYYNTDIKRFINRDIIDGTIQNSQSLNKYSYVQGNPVSLTDPFGLCPEGSGILDYLKQYGHTILDFLGLLPGVGVLADAANAIWYLKEGNIEMALISAIALVPIAGDIAAGILKGAAYASKSCKLLKASKVVKYTCRLAGATAQTGVNLTNAQNAANAIQEEFNRTGSVSWQNAGAFLVGTVGAVSGARMAWGHAMTLTAVGTQKITPVGEWGCIIAGTPVKTKDRQKNIEKIKAGDLVYAKNTETGEEGYKEVVRVFVKDVNKLVHLQIDETKIDTTTNHPFWIVGHGFKEAGDLKEGEKVLTATGEVKTITRMEVEELEVPVTVYNFEVQDWHTYYVSEMEVLVHNSDKRCGVVSDSASSGAADAISESGRTSRNILNVGAGDNPIPCATNIDINPSTAGVIYGDANNLSQFASGQFDHVIAMNPYSYNLLEGDVPRVLKDGGIMSVTGNYSNKYFKSIYNASPEALKQAGFEVISRGEAGSAFLKYGGKVTGGVRQTRGTPLQIILKKVGVQ